MSPGWRRERSPSKETMSNLDGMVTNEATGPKRPTMNDADDDDDDADDFHLFFGEGGIRGRSDEVTTTIHCGSRKSVLE